MATDVAINLAGLIAPAVAAAVSLPILFRGLGPERLGVLTLAWAAVGAFTLLDFGLGRSLTREVARRRAREESETVPALVGSALLVLMLLGVVAASLIGVGAHQLASAVDVAADLRPEVTQALVGVSVAIPFMTASSGLRGVLEAYGRFDLAALARVPLGIFTYLGPVLVLPFTDSVAVAVTTIVVARVATTLVLLMFVTWTIDAVPVAARLDPAPLRDVMVHGFWMMIASLAGVALAYVDRFVVGGTLPMTAVAYYATPQELVGKLTVVPIALSAVLYPALSRAGANAGAELSRLFVRGLTYTYLLLVPATAVGAGFAPELLTLWLGPEFAATSAPVVQWFSLAVLLQSLAIMPLNLLQAVGQAAVTARLQVVQLPLFVVGVWAGVRVAGIEGAAFVWAARMLLDLSLLLAVSRRRVPGVAEALRGGWLLVLPAVAGFALLTRLPGLTARVAVMAAGLVGFAFVLRRLVGRADLDRVRSLLIRSSDSQR
jgi:O-antigen/teichoic acid export membrane protein